MTLYLAILEGRDPASARPIVASEDPELIRRVAEALAARLGVLTPAGLRDLIRDPDPETR